MPAPGHKQSKARVERSAAKKAARAPAPASATSEPRSKLADYLSSPSQRAERALRAAASQGAINTRDVAAALIAEIIDLTSLLKAPAEEVKLKRPLLTSRTRALRALQEVVEAAPGGSGPSVVVHVVWPAEFAGRDEGDEVLTRAPKGFST